ncbi:MAG: SUF system NifU family Fe-S cluster assembly protein [SAR202 cluster bacterium]|nr:SUF system NifU family Fe-S cluster assembly protein [SAR202 cluster bacterium]
MAELSHLYQEILLEHNSKPRNFRKLEHPNHSADGYNPLCGDRINLYLDIKDGVVADVGFQGSGCAISRAASSLMTQSIKGKTVAEAEQLFREYRRMLTQPGADVDGELLGDLEFLAGVAAFPTRIKCAILSWHTLQAALEGKETATTE